MDGSSFAPAGYEIIRTLGSGGTAQVYLARKTGYSPLRALKAPLEFNPSYYPIFQSLINREYHFIGNNRYPGFVKVYETSKTDSGIPYLALEYIPGITLDQIDKIDDYSILLSLLSSVSINLYYLRLLKISHGDLKPHNIFLHDGIENFGNSFLTYSKISDFSLALHDEEQSADRLGQGTIGYIAPETIDTGELTHRSDIFALGVIAYKLATGRHPFIENETDPVRISAAVKEHHPEPPSRIVPNLPPQFDHLILSTLRKNPNERPIDGWLICEELEKLGSNYPFRKAIRPKHLLPSNYSHQASLLFDQPVLNFTEPIKERLLDYCDDDTSILRNILEINFSHNRLIWQGGRLLFADNEDNIILPKSIRNRIHGQYRTLSYRAKKAAIRASVSGSLQNALKLRLINAKDDGGKIDRSLIYVIRQYLAPPTVRRLSFDLANMAAKSAENDILAAKLYIQSQRLDEGYNTIRAAVEELLKNSHHDSALKLMDDLIELSRSNNDVNKLKASLMKKADTLRQIGDIIPAEKIYKQIIDLYPGDKTDELLAETYKDLGDLYKSRQDYQSGIEALKKAEKIYRTIGDLLEVSHTQNNIGNIYVVNNQFDMAYQSFRKALHIQKELQVPKDIASTLNNMGVVFYMKGRYGRVIRLFSIAIEINRKIENLMEMARALNNRGYMYNILGRFDDALEDLGKSLEINRKIGSKREILYNLENMTQVMLSAGRLKETLGYLREGMALADELADYPLHCSMIGNIGIVQKRMGQYGKALKNINQAIEMSEPLSDKRDLTLWLINQADLYYRLNDNARALNNAKKAFEAGLQIDDKKALISIYSLLALIERNDENFDRAEQAAREIKAVRDLSQAQLKRLHWQLASKDYKSAGRLIQILNEVFIEGNSDIENAQFYFLRGKFHYENGNWDKALGDLMKSHRFSAKMSLLPESIEAAMLLGIIYSEKMEFEAAYNHYRNAINGLKTIANDINDDELRTSFLSQERIAFVSAEIKRLAKYLTKK
jgi:serine/threonine protein kinase/Tfp pilus assembly protein PilF